ncbi:putative ribonuclease H-like domain-containing protein [Tanacetum coccineum]
MEKRAIVLDGYRNKKINRVYMVRNKRQAGSTRIHSEEVKDELMLCQPLGFEDLEFPNKVYKVEKALYGLHQAPRAWYETLSTYLLENEFRRGTINKILFIKKDKGDILFVQVYVDDIIFGSTKKSLCTEFEHMMHKRFQMSSMGEFTFFLGLQVKQKDDGIFISQDKYVADILKKFDFATVKTTSTPMETNKALLKNEEAADVDVHLYRSMIGSLMYITASRPNIMFVVCACARFQVTPKTSHLYVVKRIFRYLKGHPKLGLWYPRDSPFELEAFSDSDYAGASLDRKSTTGAEYVAAANCRGQTQEPRKAKRTTKISQSSGPIPLVSDETVIKEWEDRMERVATTASSLEAEQDSGNINRTQSMATLNESFPQGTDSGSGPRVNTLGSGEDRIKLKELMEFCTKLSERELVRFKIHDGNAFWNEIGVNAGVSKLMLLSLNLLLPVLVYAARHSLIVVRHKLMLPGITSYYWKASSIRYALTVNPTIYNSCIKQFWATAKVQTVNGERQIQALVDKKKVIITETSIRCDLKLEDTERTDCLPTATIFAELEIMGAKTTAWNKFSSTMASTIICLATTQKFNFFKYIFDNMVKNLDGGVKFIMYLSLKKQSRRKQREDSGPTEPILDEATNEEPLSTPSCDLPPSAKTAQAKEIASLKKRVKQLEKRGKSRTSRLKRLRKGKKITDLDADAEVTLIDETQERNDEEMLFDVQDDLQGEEVVAEKEVAEKEVSDVDLVTTAGEVVTTANVEVTTASAPTTTIDELTLAQTLIEIKAAKPKVVTTTATTTRPKARGVEVQEPSEFKTTSSHSQASQLPQAKDKGKAIMVEPEKPLKKKDQIAIDEEVARNLEA